MEDSPLLNETELKAISDNQRKVVFSGRDTQQTLSINQKTESIEHWGNYLLDNMAATANLLDTAQNTNLYTQALNSQRQKMSDPSTTPSAIILDTIFDKNISFYEFAMSKALEHECYFKRCQTNDIAKDDPLILANNDLVSLSKESIEKQKEIEAADTLSFEDFLAQYFSH